MTMTQNKKNVVNYDIISASFIRDFETHLHQEERSQNTISKYVRDLWSFCSYLNARELSKERVLEWKEYLTAHYAPSSVNSMLAAVNHFFEWSGLSDCKVKPLKIQRRIFSKQEKELTRSEYIRLVQTAKKNQNLRLSLILQTLCATGIRVSELQYITVESLKRARVDVDCKGKTRTIFLPPALCVTLKSYCHKQSLKAGIIFCTKSGRPLDRSNIWRDMKTLCVSANVSPEKVFPHNLRHLFARTYYTLEKDLSRLADLLGHSNINTTRIYTMESGLEHARRIEKLNLVLTC